MDPVTAGGDLLERPVTSENAAPPRQPVFNVPAPILMVLCVLLVVHIARQLVPESWDDATLTRLAFVPGRLTFAFDRAPVIDAMMKLAAQGSEGYRQAGAERFFLGDGSLQPWTTVTYALLHADWTHLGLNAVWLLAFGAPVARRLRLGRFLVFFIATAWAGAFVHYVAHPFDLAPVIGVSAAVSGCMGAALRFMFQPQPRAAVAPGGADEHRRASVPSSMPLRDIFTDRRSVTFLIAWFGTNLLFGLGAATFGLASGPIAWEAHIGGFMAGLLLFPVFDPDHGDAPIPSLEDAAP